jgi:integrase
MSRYATREHYERNHLRTCARCGRWAGKAANWSDGPICRTCLDQATRTRGPCPGCGTDRLLPGRREDETPICRDCAGITRSFFCGRCGFEGRLHTGRLCARCTLTDKVAAVLDDGTGQINQALKPLADALTAMPDPWKGWMWLRSSQVQTLLSDLATGRLALTHEALHLLANWRTVAYLRDLLMACGALPTVDKQLLHFETWLAQRLAELDGDPHERLLRRFATWEQLPRLRARADRHPLTTSSRRFTAEQFTAARTFLSWVDDHGNTLGACTQADIDIWHATHINHQKQTVRAFLNWAMSNQIMPRLDLPVIKPGKGNPITQRRRLELIRRAVTDEQVSLRTRVAACLMLLYAQPVSRLLRLTIDDVIQQEDDVFIRLGDPPTPVPEPFAALLLELADNRENMTTATNPNARWLFPGQRGGQPLNVGTVLDDLRLLGFSTATARSSALRHLVLQAPAPVIARSLGFHDQTTSRISTEAGKTWNQYAPGDHRQSP